MGSRFGQERDFLVLPLLTPVKRAASASTNQRNILHSIVCKVQMFAEQTQHLQAGVGISAKKLQQILSPDERSLTVLQHLGRDLIVHSCQGSIQPSRFTRAQGTENEPSLLFGGDGY